MPHCNLQPLRAALRRQGWEVEMTARGHWKAVPPNPALTMVHFSESEDWRALLNIVRDLCSRGFIWPEPGKKELASSRRALVLTDAVFTTEEIVMSEPMHLVPPPESAPESRPEPLAEATEDAMDLVFRELKDAKSFHLLAIAELERSRAVLKEAQRQFESAMKEEKEAAQVVRDKKKTFDGVFSP